MITVSIKMPLAQKRLITAQMIRAVALDTIVLIRERTVGGMDAKGKPFKKYSTNPLYVLKSTYPRPLGGRPAGQSVYYSGGYREYKEQSRMPGQVGPRMNPQAKGPTAEVDLTQTGLMLNSLQAAKIFGASFVIGIIGPAQAYAYKVNKIREFLGLTAQDTSIITSILSEQIAKGLR